VDGKKGDFDQVTTFVSQRGHHPSLFRACEAMKRMGLRLVYELDDDVWSIPSYNPLGSFFTPEVTKGMERIADLADDVVVTTQRLANVLGRVARNARIRVIPNAILWDMVPAPVERTKPGLRIGWAGSNTHEGDLIQVASALAKIRDVRPEVTLVFMGSLPARFEKDRERVEAYDWVTPAEYYETLASLQLDLFVAPLSEHRFNLAKSNVKLLEAGALGIPVVASDVGPYREVKNGETGLKVSVNVSTRWQSAIQELLNNERARKQMGAAAREWVRSTYSMDVTGPLWAEALGAELAQKAA
jgi:glycosyltransferase involved in cell wall biosynthesis